MITDGTFRKEFMEKVAQIGIEIENIYEEAQDIEGCFCDGQYYVVQTRPQV